MPDFVIFVSGQKGYQVLNAAISSGFAKHVKQVVLGRDSAIQYDFSEEIVNLCENSKIPCSERHEYEEHSFSHEDHMAFVAGWRWLIKEPFRQIVVFHDSLLPKYRGFNPLVTALLKKDSEIGVTAIIANKDFDCGDIVGSRSIRIDYPIKIADAIQLVSEQYFELSQAVFAAVIESGFLTGTPQDESQASFSVWRDEEDYRIDWSWSADSIVHYINCLSFPYKGASAICDGKLIRILKAETVPDVQIANRDVGKVMFIRDGKPVVICGSGLLLIIVATDDEGENALPLKKFRSRLK